MASPYNLPNYRDRYFEHKTLTKIHGQPDIDSILHLFRQVKRNVQKIKTTLGGGQWGYLAIVIATAIYNAIPGTTPFNRPTDPGTFSPAPPDTGVTTRAQGDADIAALTPAQIATQKIAHDERLRQFNECQAIESLVRDQISETIEPDFLEALRDPATDMITSNIPTIFDELMNLYGQLTPLELDERETTVKAMVFNPSTTVNVVFNAIQRFQDLCTLLKCPKQDNQLVAIAYIIFSRSGFFQDSLKTWNAKSVADRTYANMKVFMNDEYNALKRVGGLTVGDSALSAQTTIQELKDFQASLTKQLKDELTENVRSTMQAFSMQHNEENIDPNTFRPPSPMYDHNYLYGSPQQPPTQQNHMFATTQIPSPMQHLQNDMELIKAQLQRLTQPNNPNRSSSQTSESQNMDINPKTGRPYQRYCWSCGCCTHWGRNCPKKKKGHRDEATFRNRMGGSDVNCR